MPDAVVLDILHTIWCNMDSGVYTCGIFIDLKKAFHTVNHSILPAKLENYGIIGVILFQSYLSNRMQTIESLSDKQVSLCGVPQGSVLGPLFILILH